MAPELREPWAGQLSGPTGTTSEAAAALLRVLPGDGFGPPAARVAAANALAGASLPVGRDPEVEGRLRAEVEGLAAGYWGLSPPERLGAWSDLSRRGADAARLRELEPGLGVVAPTLADPGAGALAGLVRELFVLPARARAVRRNAWLLDHVAEVEEWRAALAVAHRDAPALVALEPQLRAALDPSFPLVAFAEAASAAPVRRVRMSSEVAVTGFSDRVRAAQSGSAGGGWSGPTIGGAIFALFVIVKVLALLGRSDTASSTPPPAQPKVNLSAEAHTPLSRPKPAPRDFAPEEVAEFKRYEQEKALGNSPRQPLSYAEWRRAERPAGTPGAKLPAADRPSFSFDRGLIELCNDYDRGKTRVRPALYERWLAAGRPTAPGVYPLIHPIP